MYHSLHGTITAFGRIINAIHPGYARNVLIDIHLVK